VEVFPSAGDGSGDGVGSGAGPGTGVGAGAGSGLGEVVVGLNGGNGCATAEKIEAKHAILENTIVKAFS